MPVRFALLTLAACLACALAAQPQQSADGPPAQVGRVMALSVAVDVDAGEQWGVLFPITLTSQPGSGYFDVNAELDDKMRATIRDSVDWLAEQRGDPDFPLPESFPASMDFRLEFIRDARRVAGDSAGVALGCALYSSVTNTPLLSTVAVTGAVDRQGEIHAVAHIRKKLDAVLERGLETMILPAENAWRTESEARATWQAAVPAVQVVFVRNMREALFFTTGPYGPRGREYERYQQELVRAMELYDRGEFERARANAAWLRAWHPGDSTALTWLAECSNRYAGELLLAAAEAESEGRGEEAAFLANRAAEMRPDGPPTPIGRESRQASSALPHADPEPAASLPVAFLERPAREPTDARWRVTSPVTVPLSGDGPPAVLAASSGWERFALAVSYADGSGRVETNPGRWYPDGAGWVERSREDRVAVCIGPDARVRTGALRALDYGGTVGCDAWVLGAGPLRHLRIAADLAPVEGVPAFDTGTPPLYRNAAAGGGPVGAHDGLLGSAHNEGILHVDEASPLRGDPGLGRTAFEGACRSCHTIGESEGEALSPRLALWPEGSQGLLEHRLTNDPVHTGLLDAPAISHVTAYLRTLEPPPAWLAATPEGSAGDVEGYSLFANGRWTWCFARRNSTRQADDWDLAAQPDARLAIAVRDGATGETRVSGELTLTWETPPQR